MCTNCKPLKPVPTSHPFIIGSTSLQIILSVLTMADRPTAPAQPRQTSTGTKAFLILYNSMSAVLWAAVLGRVVLLYTLRGQWKVYFGVGEFVKWTQTLAWAEVIFSLTGRFNPKICAGAGKGTCGLAGEMTSRHYNVTRSMSNPPIKKRVPQSLGREAPL